MVCKAAFTHVQTDTLGTVLHFLNLICILLALQDPSLTACINPTHYYITLMVLGSTLRSVHHHEEQQMSTVCLGLGGLHGFVIYCALLQVITRFHSGVSCT